MTERLHDVIGELAADLYGHYSQSMDEGGAWSRDPEARQKEVEDLLAQCLEEATEWSTRFRAAKEF